MTAVRFASHSHFIQQSSSFFPQVLGGFAHIHEHCSINFSSFGLIHSHS